MVPLASGDFTEAEPVFRAVSAAGDRLHSASEPMARTDELDLGRESFERQEWADAYARLSSADRRAPLPPEDLERLATAAFLIGEDTESDEAWARAHRACLHRGDAPRSARCAFWLAFGLLNRGEMARGSGWLSRAQRLIEDGAHDCV